MKGRETIRRKGRISINISASHDQHSLPIYFLHSPLSSSFFLLYSLACAATQKSHTVPFSLSLSVCSLSDTHTSSLFLHYSLFIIPLFPTTSMFSFSPSFFFSFFFTLFFFLRAVGGVHIAASATHGYTRLHIRRKVSHIISIFLSSFLYPFYSFFLSHFMLHI
jgi:hypothetical protein